MSYKEREKKMPIADIKTTKQLQECILFERREILLTKQKIEDYQIHLNEIYYRALLHKGRFANNDNIYSEDLPNMKFYGMQVVLDNEVKNYELRKKI